MEQDREHLQAVMDQAVREELQTFVNNPTLDLPETRRDLSKPENIRWLQRNILIRNAHLISHVQYKALGDLAKRS